jgi:hypothetical protein
MVNFFKIKQKKVVAFLQLQLFKKNICLPAEAYL